MKWYGITFPKKILEIEHDIKLHLYKGLCSEEKYFEQALKNEGLKEDDLLAIRKGSWVKTQNALDNAEKELEEMKKGGDD